MNKQVKADLMLLFITGCWGVSYYLMDISLADLDPFTLNAHRFLFAFLAAAVLSWPKLKSVNKTTLKYSFYIGCSLVVVYIGATFGVKYTSLSNAGFLCALSVVITPIFAYFVNKEVPGRKLSVVVVLCIAGIALLTLNENLKPAVGDLLCIMCAVAYSADLILTERAVRKEEVNAYQLGVFQLGFTGVIQLVLALALEKPHLPGSNTVLAAVLFLAVFCTGLAFIIQAVAQQYTSATHVGVIFALEPVFAGLVAYFFAGEVLLPRAYLGAVLLVAGCFIMEIDFRALLSRKKTA